MTCPDCDGTGKRSTLEGSITVLLDEPCRFCGGSGDVSLATASLDVSGPPVALNEACVGPACQHEAHAIGAPDEVDALRAERDRWKALTVNFEELHARGERHASAELDKWRARHASAEREIAVWRRRVDALEAALREIAAGKKQEDVTHPLGEWFSMAGRFITIACRTLKEQT